MDGGENTEKIDEPYIGQLFDSHSEAFNFYRAYALKKGFGVLIKNTSRNEDNEQIYATYGCYRSGFHKSKNPLKPSEKIGCKAVMRVSLQYNRKWKVTSVDLTHNHDLMDPENTKFLKSHRKLSAHMKRKLELNAAAGIRLCKNFAAISVEAGGPQNLPFIERDARNYLDGVRRSQLKEGDPDADATNRNFVKMQEYDDGFSHSRVQNEEDEDIRCMRVEPDWISPFPFENQFKEAYTLEKFMEFQKQIALIVGCTNLTFGPVINGISEIKMKHTMIVGKEHPMRKEFSAIVHYNEETKQANCSCRLFESKGMVCSHMIKVWGEKDVEKVPDEYILNRWKKDLVDKPEWKRFERMQAIWEGIVNKAMFSDAATDLVVTKLTELGKLIKEMSADETANMALANEYPQETLIHMGDPAKGVKRRRSSTEREVSNTEKCAKRMSEKQTNAPIDIGENGYCPNLTQDSFDFYQSQMVSASNESEANEFEPGYGDNLNLFV